MVNTLITAALLMQVLGIVLAMGMGRAAANGDRQLADCAIEQGLPHVAALYLNGGAV